MEKNLIKTLAFNNQLKKKAVIESFYIFKDELLNEENKLKYIIVTINLIKHSKKSGDNLSIELVNNFKINITNKNYDKLNSEIFKIIKIIKEHSNIEGIRTMTFNDIKFIYKPIDFYKYINKEDYNNLINKIIKRY